MSGKIGEGHLEAMARVGLNEIRATVYPGSNITQTDLGVFGNATPGEIGEARNSREEPVKEEEKGDSPLQQSMRTAESRSPAPVIPALGIEK